LKFKNNKNGDDDNGSFHNLQTPRALGWRELHEPILTRTKKVEKKTHTETHIISDKEENSSTNKSIKYK
jgi:hypothetical protein